MIESIIEKLERDPFQPFQIVLSNGDRYEVPNPRLVAIGRSLVFLAAANSDRFAELRQNQIAAVESLESRA